MSINEMLQQEKEVRMYVLNETKAPYICYFLLSPQLFPSVLRFFLPSLRMIMMVMMTMTTMMMMMVMMMMMMMMIKGVITSPLAILTLHIVTILTVYISCVCMQMLEMMLKGAQREAQEFAHQLGACVEVGD